MLLLMSPIFFSPYIKYLSLTNQSFIDLYINNHFTIHLNQKYIC